MSYIICLGIHTYIHAYIEILFVIKSCMFSIAFDIDDTNDTSHTMWGSVLRHSKSLNVYYLISSINIKTQLVNKNQKNF